MNEQDFAMLYCGCDEDRSNHSMELIKNQNPVSPPRA